MPSNGFRFPIYLIYMTFSHCSNVSFKSNCLFDTFSINIVYFNSNLI